MPPRPGLDRGAVVDAAVELAEADGYANVTLASLAAKLGVKTPSLYNHISGLPELRKELAVFGLIKFRDALMESAVGLSGEEAVLAIALAYVAFARSRPGLYDAITAAALLKDADIQEHAERIVGLLVRVLASYGFEHNTALHHVRALRSLAHGFAVLEKQEGFNMILDKDESLRIAITTYLRGMRS